MLTVCIAILYSSDASMIVPTTAAPDSGLSVIPEPANLGAILDMPSSDLSGDIPSTSSKIRETGGVGERRSSDLFPLCSSDIVRIVQCNLHQHDTYTDVRALFDRRSTLSSSLSSLMLRNVKSERYSHYTLPVSKSLPDLAGSLQEPVTPIQSLQAKRLPDIEAPLDPCSAVSSRNSLKELMDEISDEMLRMILGDIRTSSQSTICAEALSVLLPASSPVSGQVPAHSRDGSSLASSLEQSCSAPTSVPASSLPSLPDASPISVCLPFSTSSKLPYLLQTIESNLSYIDSEQSLDGLVARLPNAHAENNRVSWRDLVDFSAFCAPDSRNGVGAEAPLKIEDAEKVAIRSGLKGNIYMFPSGSASSVLDYYLTACA